MLCIWEIGKLKKYIYNNIYTVLYCTILYCTLLYYDDIT